MQGVGVEKYARGRWRTWGTGVSFCFLGALCESVCVMGVNRCRMGGAAALQNSVDVVLPLIL